MARVDYEKLMDRKEKSIERAIDKKQESIEFQSTRKDAIELLRLEMELATLPTVATREDLQKAVVDWMNFLFAMREEDQTQDAEPIREVQPAVEAVKETFPGAKEVQTKTIKNPEEKLTAPQHNFITKLLGGNGKEEVIKAETMLGLPNLAFLGDLTKGQAKTLIDKLLAEKK